MTFEYAAFADESSTGLAGQIDALKRNGYSYLEIRNIDGKNFTKLTTDEAKEIANILKDNGLSIRSIGSPIGKIAIDGDFEAHMERHKRALELANIFGADRIRLFSFFMPKGEDPEQYWQKVLEQVGQLVETAISFGITPCHENEKGIYGDIASRCLRLHQAIPELKAVFDPANFIQCGQDTLQAWQLLHPYVSYMHIKDALPDGQVVAPGKGHGNLPQLLKAYAEQGGTLLSLEPHLFDFMGLKNLEQKGDASVVGGMSFATGEEAFDYAAASLKKIVEGIV